MSNNVKYIIYSLLDFGLTFGGTAAVIVCNFISEDNSTGYKLGFGGVVLFVALLLTAKYMFEKSYRRKLDTYLQQLAAATDAEVKVSLNTKIDELKVKNNIYERMMCLLPFAIVYIVTWLGEVALSNLNSTTGLILASMGAGSVFNIIKKPLADKISYEKITTKAKKGA